MGIPQYANLTNFRNGRWNWTGQVRVVESKIEDPLRWRKPKLIFVNSMSDLFHEDTPESDIVRIADVMHRASWHVFQVLTKRSQRMHDLLNSQLQFAAQCSHIFWGVSVDDRRIGLPRIEHLRSANVARRFLSVEPLLEGIGELNLDGIDWVIVGGESGFKARPFDTEWARSIIAQCRAAAVPCFMKQLGSHPVHYGVPVTLRDFKGGNPAEWQEDLRVREYAQPMAELIHNSHLSIKCKPSMEKSKPDNTRPQQDSMAESRRNAAVKAWVTRRAKLERSKNAKQE